MKVNRSDYKKGMSITDRNTGSSIRSLIFFCKMHHRIPFFLALRLSVRQFQMPLKGFVKTLATFGIINATESLIQNTARIFCLR